MLTRNPRNTLLETKGANSTAQHREEQRMSIWGSFPWVDPAVLWKGRPDA